MSGEETKAVAEVARATGEVAKLGGKAIDAATGLGSWVSKTVGTIPEDLLGIAGGDWLKEQRKRNLISLQEMTEKKLQDRINAGTLMEPSVSVVLPLLKTAADENRPELQELWAGLLATSFQSDGGQRVRRAFFDTLQKLEPPDVMLFDAGVRQARSAGSNRFDMTPIAEKKGITGDDRTVSTEALERLNLIQFSSMSMDGHHRITPYGRAFWEACNPQKSD